MPCMRYWRWSPRFTHAIRYQLIYVCNLQAALTPKSSSQVPKVFFTDGPSWFKHSHYLASKAPSQSLPGTDPQMQSPPKFICICSYQRRMNWCFVWTIKWNVLGIENSSCKALKTQHNKQTNMEITFHALISTNFKACINSNKTSLPKNRALVMN